MCSSSIHLFVLGRCSSPSQTRAESVVISCCCDACLISSRVSLILIRCMGILNVPTLPAVRTALAGCARLGGILNLCVCKYTAQIWRRCISKTGNPRRKQDLPSLICSAHSPPTIGRFENRMYYSLHRIVLVAQKLHFVNNGIGIVFSKISTVNPPLMRSLD